MAGNRQFWTMDETWALLKIWSDDSVQRHLEGLYRNEEVIRFIVDELTKLGIQRTTIQVREKLKKLRQQYKITKTRGRTKRFPFFELMDGVLGSRPKTEETVLYADPQTPASFITELQLPVMDQSVQGHSPSSPGLTILEADTDSMEKTATLLAAKPENTEFVENTDDQETNLTRTRPETRKRKAKTTATKEFLDAMLLCNKQWLEKEHEISREEGERELKLRREEMQQELALRREEGEREERLRHKEMEARRKDNELLASTFMQIAKLLTKDPSIL